MPRNVRNFWVELWVDGRKSPIAAGPKSAGGGFTMYVKVRRNGEISDEVLVIEGECDTEGKLQVISHRSKSGYESIYHTLLEGQR